jgi:hypothetical protein
MSQVHPIDRFYRVHFANSQALREWSLRALEIAASRDDVPTSTFPRTVVFVPAKTRTAAPVHGYVSEAARSLASSAAQDIAVDETAVSIRDLPDGLALLLGDASDTTAYEQRLSDRGA